MSTPYPLQSVGRNDAAVMGTLGGVCTVTTLNLLPRRVIFIDMGQRRTREDSDIREMAKSR